MLRLEEVLYDSVKNQMELAVEMKQVVQTKEERMNANLPKGASLEQQMMGNRSNKVQNAVEDLQQKRREI